MSRYKNVFFFLIFPLITALIVIILVLKLKNNSKKREDFDSSIIVSNAFKRGINLDNTTSGTKPTPGNWLGNWPLTTETIKYVRTYSVSPSWLEWLRYLTDNKVSVFIGINSVADVNTLITELKTWKKSYSNRLSYIIGLSVANEPNSSEVQRVKDTANELIKQLTSNNINLQVPITACFVYNTDWIDFSVNKLKHPELYKSGDGPLDNVICFNIYGNLFDGTNLPVSSPEQLTKSLDWSKGYMIPNQIDSIRNAMKGSGMSASQLWITEVGWTSEPIPEIKNPKYPNNSSKDIQHKNAAGKGWASLENEKRFYNNFLTANPNIGVHWPEYVFWFTIRDTRTATKNESFGLLYNNGQPKFSGNPIPNCGSSCDDSCKCPDSTVCDKNFAICAPSDCSSIPCPEGYKCDQTKKSCVPILQPDEGGKFFVWWKILILIIIVVIFIALIFKFYKAKNHTIDHNKDKFDL